MNDKNESPFTGLSKPTQRALANAGTTGVEHLASLTKLKLMNLHGIVKGSLPQIIKMTNEKQLTFSIE